MELLNFQYRNNNNNNNNGQERFLHAIGIVMIYFLLFGGIISCTSSRDIYKNPVTPSENIVVKTVQELQVSNNLQPEWIHAISKNYYVGTGHGKTIDEAKRAALNDIKSFILTSLGEVGSVSEISIVENQTTGRTNNKARETYLNSNSFSNSFKPIINLSTESFEDYYWSDNKEKASYYIKYKTNEHYFERIRKECYAALSLHELKKTELQKRIDSLCSISHFELVEYFVKRKETLITLHNTKGCPDKSDSIKVINCIYRINRVLENLSIKPYTSNANSICFVLKSEGRILGSNHVPWLSCDDIISLTPVEELQQGWGFAYHLEAYDKNIYSVKISLDFPGLSISNNIEIKNITINPNIELKEAIELVRQERNFWKDKIVKGKIKITFLSESTFEIQRIEIIPVSRAGKEALISFTEFTTPIKPGMNFLELKLTRIFPLQFINSVTHCDVRFYYKIQEQVDYQTFESVPFKTIN